MPQEPVNVAVRNRGNIATFIDGNTIGKSFNIRSFKTNTVYKITGSGFATNSYAIDLATEKDTQGKPLKVGMIVTPIAKPYSKSLGEDHATLEGMVSDSVDLNRSTGAFTIATIQFYTDTSGKNVLENVATAKPAQVPD